MKEENILWLARCLFTETYRADEQIYVGWCIRNRVETGYKGTSYEGVVLSPYQFSAFNPNFRRRQENMTRPVNFNDKTWRTSLASAEIVVEAAPEDNPFIAAGSANPTLVRHYFSPVSMLPGKYTLRVDPNTNYGMQFVPNWFEPSKEVMTPVTGRRFRFFERIR